MLRREVVLVPDNDCDSLDKKVRVRNQAAADGDKGSSSESSLQFLLECKHILIVDMMLLIKGVAAAVGG